MPVSLPILRKFLDRKSANYVCKLVPDIFHSKIIWWEGYGVYIGSANLTDNGWYGNIEAGIFLNDEEIAKYNLEPELLNFFDEIDNRSVPLTEEIYSELNDINKNSQNISKLTKKLSETFDKTRKIPRLDPLRLISNKTSSEKRRNSFLVEWLDTLQILRDIADIVSKDEYRPEWVKKDLPKGVQADQFLHAFYYSNVRAGNKSLHYEFHEKNKHNPQKALEDALKWWKSRLKAPHSEDEIWPVSELSTPKWTKVEATFSCGLSQLRLTYLFTVSI